MSGEERILGGDRDYWQVDAMARFVASGASAAWNRGSVFPGQVLTWVKRCSAVPFWRIIHRPSSDQVRSHRAPPEPRDLGAAPDEFDRKAGGAQSQRAFEPREESGMTESRSITAADSVIEILTLTLKPGTRDRFHHVYVTEALPLLRKWRFNVVAHGPSQHDENSYYVIRSFPNLD